MELIASSLSPTREVARSWVSGEFQVQIIKTKAELNRILASHCGKEPEQIHRDSERDRYFSAEEAVRYGLADEVLTEPPKEASGVLAGVR